jgi:SNF2-related domain
MATYDPASSKTLEALKTELKEVAKDINHQNQLLLRHMRAPAGIEMEGIDFKPMIADNIERLEGKRALLAVDIDEREAYQRMPQQQHQRPATQSSRPSQSKKTGNNTVNTSIVPRPSQIRYPGYGHHGVYYPVDSSQRAAPFGSSPPVAPLGQYPTAQHKQPRSFGATNQPNPAIPGLSLANQPSSLYRAPAKGMESQNTTPSSVSFEFGSDIFVSTDGISGRVTPVSMAANPLLSRTHQPGDRETELFEPKPKRVASSSSSSIVNTPSTDAIDYEEEDNGAGANLLDRLLGTSAVKRKHELEKENEESERQLEIEKTWKAQREVEDEEFARRLQEEEYSENSGQPTPLSQSPSPCGSRGPAMFGRQSLLDIGLGSFERRGSSDSLLSWNMPSPERRPSTASSASMGPPPLPLLPPHSRRDLFPSLGQPQSVTQHHAAGQPQQPPSTSSFSQNSQNQTRNLPTSPGLPSSPFRGPQSPSLPSRMRHPPQVPQTSYAPQSSPTPIIDLTNLGSDSEPGTPPYQQPNNPMGSHEQHHSQGLPHQQSNTATVWHQGPYNQGFQPYQPNNPGVSPQQLVDQMFLQQQQNTPGLPHNSQYPPFPYEQPNALGFLHASQYALSHQQPNAPRFPHGSQYSPFQHLQPNTPGFPLLQNMGSSVTNTDSPIPFDSRHAPRASQQEHNLRFSQPLQDTESTISNLGSSLMSGAVGMINSAYDTCQGGYNALHNRYAGSSTSAYDASRYGTYPYDVSRPGTYPSSSRSRNNMPDTTPNEDLKQLLDNILPDGSFADREGTPEAMAGNLYEHQKVGLAWMKSMEKGSNKGGILADDMGLGKTIQALALMVSNRSPDQECNTTLIVCTVALVDQWKTEIQEKVKPDFEHRLSVFVYHNEPRKTQWESLKQYDVVLTTYGTVAAEYKRYIELLGKDDGEDGAEDDERRDQAESEGSGVSRTMASSASEDRKSKKALPPRNANLPLLGRNSLWYRVILDEAQNVKNKNTKASQAVCALKSTYRWCMTGTPMMNGIEELYSLIKFLAIKPYCDHLKFKEVRDNGSESYSVPTNFNRTSADT